MQANSGQEGQPSTSYDLPGHSADVVSDEEPEQLVPSVCAHAHMMCAATDPLGVCLYETLGGQ